MGWKRRFKPPRRFTPPRIVTQVAKIATAPLRVSSVALLSPFKPDLAKKIGGLSGTELGIAKIGGVGTLAVFGGALAAKAGFVGKLAAVAKGPMQSIFKTKGGQLQEQADAAQDSTTTAEGGQARADAPEPFSAVDPKASVNKLFTSGSPSLPQGAEGAQIVPASDWLDSLIKKILSLFGV